MIPTLKPEHFSGGRLYQRVAQQLAATIAQGEYTAGTRLPAERKLAERFEVSRPTIREAIIALELAGLVEVRGGSGVYVRHSDPLELGGTPPQLSPFDILEARIVFEGEAAALAAKNITEQELAEVRQALHTIVDNHQEATFSETADADFHRVIARATKNAAIVSVCRHLWSLRDSAPVSTSVAQRVYQAGGEARIDEHKAILIALEQRNPEAARAAMREHLRRVIRQLLDAIEADAVAEARRAIALNRERFNLADEH
ncbi:FadR/GntR family transcriptional regulator [Gilvimarinus sp. 1_MG-2023]|uniref:FadR/GntR family transcriptional regulator n=1 Tax=Gilvimarinus sp. 1_MG-2023 TaxID=3062638 RepID=UPI0026E12D4F|nr:FadR/GntR family transcriptional regulator [Gilvimarinus sp. 1_MG-2023]MDO6748333.1 FadR/GntR family transcriptional regulator [Gilvimarinus sp. 1_MG-2023]